MVAGKSKMAGKMLSVQYFLYIQYLKLVSLIHTEQFYWQHDNVFPKKDKLTKRENHLKAALPYDSRRGVPTFFGERLRAFRIALMRHSATQSTNDSPTSPACVVTPDLPPKDKFNRLLGNVTRFSLCKNCTPRVRLSRPLGKVTWSKLFV